MTTKNKFLGTEEIEKKYSRISFGQLLETHRLCEDLSQKDFSKLLKISPASLCDLEKGRKIPSVSRAAKIAEALGVSQKMFVETAIQDQLNREGLEDFKVSVA